MKNGFANGREPDRSNGAGHSSVSGDGLNDRQRAFVEEYLIDKNGSKAYRRAGYTTENPEAGASSLLTNPNVQVAIQKGLERRKERAALSADWVLERLRIEALDEFSFAQARIRALELLGKHLGMFGETLTVNGKLQHEHTHTNKMAEIFGNLPPEMKQKLLEALEKKKEPLLIPAEVSNTSPPQ
jgi:phage terminase small subunit